MADEEHLAKLEEGIKAWNKWRRENIAIVPDLQNANLREANLQGADLQKAILKGANLRLADLKEADLWNAKLQGADFQEANLQGTNLWNVKLQGADLTTCYGSPRFKRFAQDQEFIEEFRDSPLRFPLYLIWLIFSDCGRSLLLWASWSIFAAIGFGWKFYSMGREAFDIDALPWKLSTLIYYSVVTFTTLGFGDITPNTTEAAYWVMAEVILGYVMLGGLISIFATKLARRS
jgi:hypothetical protein